MESTKVRINLTIFSTNNQIELFLIKKIFNDWNILCDKEFKSRNIFQYMLANLISYPKGRGSRLYENGVIFTALSAVSCTVLLLSHQSLAQEQ